MREVPYILWYDKPSEQDYYKGIPIGNGYMGCMIYGDPHTDIIHINEGTIWTGSPYENNVGQTKYIELREKQLTDINQDRDWETGLILGKQSGYNVDHGQTFQYAGQLLLNFDHDYDKESYRRELDINNAIASCSYVVGNTEYKKDFFASHTSNIMAVQITSSGKLDFSISFVSDMNGKVSYEGDEIIYDGITDSRKGIEGKLEYRVLTKVIPSGGRVKTDKECLYVIEADSCVIYMTVATNFIDYRTLGGDYREKAYRTIHEAIRKGYDLLKSEHIQDYKAIFDKVSIYLGTDHIKPTDERIDDFSESEDSALISLFFQYNRYLLISSSREGGQAANLQGCWNNKKYPPWDSKYTTNINLQMNYWPAYIANLNECAIPFTKKVNELKAPGSITAKKLYNIDNGWVLHHNTDLWNITGPVDGPWGITPTCGAWLANQLFDQYLYSMDKDYLESIYDTLKGAAEFMLSFLTEYTCSKGNSYLVTCPSTSPENIHKGINAYISFASAFDIQITHQLFCNIIKAAKTLKRDALFISSVENAKAKLPPCVNIGRWGQVQEFCFHDTDDINDTHRHISHLIGVYPFTVCDIQNEEIRKAVNVTLAARTKPGDWTGWGIGWRICQYARLSDGESAYRMIKIIFNPKNRLIYPNLLGAHPMGEKDKVFQIDCNFGALAGISEMFVCSAYDKVQILPAVPKRWNSGYVSGLCAKGGFTVDVEWKDSSLKKVTVYSSCGGTLNLGYMDKCIYVQTERGNTYYFDGSLSLMYQ